MANQLSNLVQKAVEIARTVFRRQEPGFYQLIDDILDRIQQIGLRRPYVAKIRGHQRMYLARAGKDMRIIFQVEDGMMTILDIVSHDKIQRLSRLYDWDTGV